VEDPASVADLVPQEVPKARVTPILHDIFESDTITPRFCITDTGGTYSE
jgi:hypothetical protein